MLQKEAAVVVVTVFVITMFVTGYVLWFERAVRKYQRLCCCQSTTVEPTGKTDWGNVGRQRDNGEWFSQTQPFHVHIYSAFYDNRPSLRSEPQLAVIAVLDRRLLQQPRLSCHVWYSTLDEAVVLNAYPMPTGAGKLMADGSELMENVITCPVTTDQCMPVSVSLAWGTSLGEVTSFRVPIELPDNPSDQRSLAVCVSASFGHVDTHRLIEWLEMQSILGAQYVIIYNHSVSQSVGHILSQYQSQVELRQTRAFMSEPDFLLHMSPVINDCIYRFSARFRYFAVIDLDEVIVPRHDYTIPALIQSLSSQQANPVAVFTFRNSYFFLDIPVDDLQQPSHPHAVLSTYLVHRRRLAASPPTYSVKSIVSCEACISMHNHYCWTYTADALSYWNLRVDVEPSDALLHHYKRCHLDSYLHQRGHCKSVMSATVVDNVINKYSSLLADRLHMRYLQFNLTAPS